MSFERSIASKTARILKLIALIFLLLLLRCWYLTAHKESKWDPFAARPKMRRVVESAERGAIYDRFGLPLATSKVQYNAAIYYAHIKQIPRVSSTRNEKGQKVRTYPRADYIAKLSKWLGQELDLEPSEIEDLIHGRAALFPHTPFIIKRDVDEKIYYKLKLMQRDFPGLRMEKGARRVYPRGKVACDVIGYLGAISDKEYRSIVQERAQLQHYLSLRDEGRSPFLPRGYHSPLEVRARLAEIEEKTYTIRDLVGKSGLESKFDSLLRGYFGKKLYEVDIDGNFIKELPGSNEKIDGKQLQLTLSAELQEYAEQLLASNEHVKSSEKDRPWIAGGAIVALLPETGEVLCLASHPRFDPSDFLPGSSNKSRVHLWLEGEKLIAQIWDGVTPLSKEVFKDGRFETVSQPLTWEFFLSELLSKKSDLFKVISTISQIKTFYAMQEEGALQAKYLSLISHPKDKILLQDLSRLLLHREDFSQELIEQVGHISPSSYRAQTQIACQMRAHVQQSLVKLFKARDFKEWKEANFKEFLKEKRKEEKRERRYNKPYIDYLEQMEKELFALFWEEKGELLTRAFILADSSLCGDNRLKHYYDQLVLERGQFEKKAGALELFTLCKKLNSQQAQQYLQSMRSYKELTAPLKGSYSLLRKSSDAQQQELHLAAGFYPVGGYGFGRSQAFRQSTPSGSLFKLVVGYEAMMERYRKGKSPINPLTLIDDSFTTNTSNSQVLGQLMNGEKIHRLYKGGRLPRGHPNIGKIDMVGAIEDSSNIYFSLLAAEHVDSTDALCATAKSFGYGRPTGIALPGEIGGVMPNDLSRNKTGLYAFAIGQHSLVVTPLQSAMMLTTIFNGGKRLVPRIVKAVSGREVEREQSAIFRQKEFAHKADLALVGIDFPLFTQNVKSIANVESKELEREIAELVPMPKKIQATLFEGMWKAVNGSKGTARSSRMSGSQEMVKDYIDLKEEIAGKTGTAEILYKKTLDAQTPPSMETHVWFGGCSFKKSFVPAAKAGNFEGIEPEIVVVVYLRFGKAGKEAAPFAAQMIKKWREIKAKHELKAEMH